MQPVKWIIALSVSATLHGVLGHLYGMDETSLALEGANIVEIMGSGDAFSNVFSAGVPVLVAEPVETVSEEMQPYTQSDMVTSPLVPTTTDVHNTRSQQTIDQTAEVQHSGVKSVGPFPLAIPQKTTGRLSELASIAPDQIIVPVPAPRKIVEPVVNETVNPVAKKKSKERTKEQQKLSTRGDQGKAKASAKEGKNNQVNENAKRRSTGNSKTLSARGDASVSTYPGIVRKKIRRAQRKPGSRNVSGDVIVTFLIAKSGAVSRVRVTKGSGNTLIDQAAVKSVLRAAPFPKIPDAAKRANWPMSIPITFKRG